MTFFKIGRRIAATVAAVAFCTCGTLDRIEVGTGASAEIAKATLVGELLGLVDFSEFEEISFSQDIANQGVSEDQIDSVKIKTFVIETEEGSGATLDFIDSVEFYAEAPDQPKVLIASSLNFQGQTSVELELEEDVELKPYVIAPYMTLSAVVNGEQPDQDTILTADVILSVDVTIPGCE